MFYIELKHDARIKTATSGFNIAAGFYRAEQKPPRMDATNGYNLLDSMPAQLAYQAERVWLETEEKIEYIKNRLDHNNVDMEEFMWVKLAAKDIRK